VRYTISDLTGGDAQALAGLAAAVEKLVAPDSWQSSGGQGSIDAKDGMLVVVQTGNVHYQIISFCEKLRTARGKALRSRLSPELFTLATRVDRAKELLDHPVTVNFHEANLTEVLAYLKQSAGAEVLVDWPALQDAGMADEVKGTVRVEKKPLGAALGQLLAPLKLTYRVVDGKTLQVTTPKAAESRLELEFYPVGGLLAKEQPAALIDRIKGRLPEAAWSESGGPGVLHIDAASQCLIVLQSQPVQRALQAVLREKVN
jgi:hypothetical protein